MVTTGGLAENDRLLRHGWPSWVTLYACWALPALLTGASAFAIQRAADEVVPLGRTLLQQLWYYWLFASICPPVYRLNVRLPLGRRDWPRTLGVHVVACLVVSAVAMILAAGVDVLLGVRPLPVSRAIVEEFTTPRGQFRGVVNVFYYVVVVGAMELIRVNRRRREHEEQATELRLRASQLEAQVARARLAALEMQLNPHFLLNALNDVASLVEQGRNDDAYRAVALLGELLRETLRNGERPVVPLSHELASIGKYLELERLRFSDRLRADVRLQDDCRGARVPAMILQPVVENAVRHGLAARSAPCSIVISARREGGQVRLDVRDDGPGLPAGWSLERDAGTGLDNVRQRLHALYAHDAELRVEPAGATGVAASIVLPFVESGAEPGVA